MNGKNGELAMKFTKMQGLGNDYVYVNCFKETIEDPSAVAKFVSNRNFGIGSDGLILICPSETADFQMVMYNADGSRGEMCGNGIRCVAKYVYDYGLTDKTRISVETLGGIKYLDLAVENGKVCLVKVDMGEPHLAPEEIPIAMENKDVGKVIDEEIDVDGRKYRMTGVSMGNPHTVVYMDDLKELEIETGACAVAVASILNGLTKRKVTVKLLGGDLIIEWEEDTGHVFMTGPAEVVFDGEIDLSGIAK